MGYADGFGFCREAVEFGFRAAGRRVRAGDVIARQAVAPATAAMATAYIQTTAWRRASVPAMIPCALAAANTAYVSQWIRRQMRNPIWRRRPEDAATRIIRSPASTPTATASRMRGAIPGTTNAIGDIRATPSSASAAAWIPSAPSPSTASSRCTSATTRGRSRLGAGRERRTSPASTLAVSSP